MTRLNAVWNNFNLRGQDWDHFWQDSDAGGPVTYTDTGGAVAILVASGVDAIVQENIGGATGILVGSGTDAPTQEDAGNAVGILSGSGVDQYEIVVTYSDVGSATGNLIGSGVDEYTSPAVIPVFREDSFSGGRYEDIFRVPTERVKMPTKDELRRKREEEEIMIM